MFTILVGATMPYRVLWNRQRMRWSLGADDIVFTQRKHQVFFSLGKTIPITRGDGIYQRSMNFALEQINQGDWVHVFPEGIDVFTHVHHFLCLSFSKNKFNKRFNAT
jgi:hypothetical protein